MGVYLNNAAHKIERVHPTASHPLFGAPQTLAGWIRRVNTTVAQTILQTSADITDSNGFRIEVTAAGVARAGQKAAGSNTNSSAGTISDSNWHHVAGIFPDNSVRTAYLDGVAGVQNASGRAAVVEDRILIGATYVGGALTQNIGQELAEVAGWNVVLTDAEIASLAAGASPLLVRPQNLAFYAPLRGSVKDLLDNLAWGTENHSGFVGHPRIYLPAGPRIYSGAPAGPTIEALVGLGSSAFGESSALQRRRHAASSASATTAATSALACARGVGAGGVVRLDAAAALSRALGLLGAGAARQDATAALNRLLGLAAAGSLQFAGSATFAGTLQLQSIAAAAFAASAGLAVQRGVVSATALAFADTANLRALLGLASAASKRFGSTAAVQCQRAVVSLDVAWSWTAAADLSETSVRPPTRQLQILLALKALVQAALPAAIVRGFDADAASPHHVAAGGCVIGHPGEPDPPDYEFGPLPYVFQQRVDVEVVAADGAGGDALDAMLEALGAAVVADRTLGGLCEWVEASAARRADGGNERVATMNWAAVPIVAEYRVSNPLGV